MLNKEKLSIEEVTINTMDAFWEAHLKYLLQDGLISEPEDIEYFQGQNYRGVIKEHMQREKDKHHLVYFFNAGEKIGAASYCIYQSEDGKCFILDYWMFPPFRNRGYGHKCFEALQEYVKKDGAAYYEINCDGRADRMRFWKGIGFEENGVDEYGALLLIKPDTDNKARCPRE